MFGYSGFLLIMGSSNILGLPRSYWLVIIGFTFSGIFQVFVFVPIITELLEELQVTLRISEKDDVRYNSLNDKVADGYGLVFSLSNFASPNVGNLIFEQTDKKMPVTFDYTSIFFFCYGIIIFIFNCGYNFKEVNELFKIELASINETEDGVVDRKSLLKKNDNIKRIETGELLDEITYDGFEKK